MGDGSSALGDAVARPRDDRQQDLLQPALEEIIDLGHPLVRLAREIDWDFLKTATIGTKKAIKWSLPIFQACRPLGGTAIGGATKVAAARTRR